MSKRILVTGAGGFIGSHLVESLRQGYGAWVRGADLKLPEYNESFAHEFCAVDLRNFDNCLAVTKDIEEVYNLAADMGGIGYITSHLADIARNNTLINANMLEAARINGVKKFLFSSSACVYAQSKQYSPDVIPLQEGDAYPADPEPGYGWEKLYAEQLCKYYHKDYGLDIRIVRFHNVFGPLGTYQGGKEKSPAALCRKIAHAPDGGAIEIWGDGRQTRSYLYISDCVDGLVRLMEVPYTEPLNLGRNELVSVDQLFDAIAKTAGKNLAKKHDLDKPQGVRGRNSDNSRLFNVLRWEPELTLDRGLERTYKWIAQEVQTHNFYSLLMSPGDLVFDIGANAGNKTRIFRDLDATVVSVEPQKTCSDYLSLRFRDHGSRVTVIPKAVGEAPGKGNILIGQHTGVSTLSQEWLAAVTSTNRFSHLKWEGRQETDITTLDDLIQQYGVPTFIKIDVEGYESRVLGGLSRPVKALCFEFHPEYLEDTARCINRLNSLGMTEFNYSLEESLQMSSTNWMTGAELLPILSKFQGDNSIYGDIYTRLPQ